MEQLEKNKVKVILTVTPERFREGLQYSYGRNKHAVQIPGFRKGKAPRKIIERLYGKEFFHDDAIKYILPDAYENACDELNIEPVYRPNVRLEEADEEKGCVFVAEVWVKPEVTVRDYRGLTYPPPQTEATEGDVQERLRLEAEKNARQVSVSRPSQEGDILTINFTGYTDGVPFEGGSGANFSLTLGSHSFIDTFEEQLAGRVPGDDVTVKVRFPDDYHHAALAGKDAEFNVEVLDVKAKEYPEIDDDFAQDVSEFDTLEAYRADLAEKISKEKEARVEDEKRLHVLRQLAERAEMDVPAAMYQARLEERMEDFKARLKAQGMTLDMYMQYTGATENALLSGWQAEAKVMVDTELALEAVARQENLTVDDEEVEAECKNHPGVDQKTVKEAMLKQKALDFVLDNAVAMEIVGA